jgi:hypothetical protein
LQKKQVLTYADFVTQDEADVEDLFERTFYVDLVNNEFGKELQSRIDAVALDARVPRTVRAIEAWLVSNPLKFGAFGHYRPARYFSENVSALWPRVSDQTKDRFEAVFKQLNSLLK